MGSKKETNTTYIQEVSWVKRGKQRREIIPFLKGTQTPTEISKASGYSLNHTSRVITDFRKRGLMRVLNPKEKTGRLYELTTKGKKVQDSV